MKRTASTLAALSLAVLVGCAGVEPTRVFIIPPGSIVLTEDLETIKNACSNVITPGVIVGCYQPRKRTLFCSPSAAAICGHELLHHVGLRHEDFHH